MRPWSLRNPPAARDTRLGTRDLAAGALPPPLPHPVMGRVSGSGGRVLGHQPTDPGPAGSGLEIRETGQREAGGGHSGR